MSKREDIIANIVTTLNTITVANLYNYDISTVTREIKHFRDLDSYPSALVLNAGEERESKSISGNHVRSLLTVRIRGIVKAEEEIETVANNFLEDIEIALCSAASRRRGGYAEDTWPSKVYMYNGPGKDIQIFDIDFELWYNFLYGSP